MAFSLDGYIDIAERIRTFAEKYPDGRLRPADPKKPYTIEQVGDSTFVVYVAAAHRDESDRLPGIGIAWEPFPGKTQFTKDSELQNAETSAWGRAIVAALAADTQRGVASKQEVRNRHDDEIKVPTVRRQPAPMPGFATLKEQQKAHDDYAALAAAQSEPVKEALKRWRADQRYPYPMSAEQLTAARAYLESLLPKASGAGASDDIVVGRTTLPASSPAPVSEPADVRSEPQAQQVGAGGSVLAEGPGLREEPEGGRRDGPDEPSANSHPLGDDYDEWEQLQLIAECAERQIDVRANASIKTMAEKLRAWDRAFADEAGRPC